jgi:tol-pal system protein YbgF
LAGCATRADLVKLQKDQREVRALLADTQVAVDNLRRRVDALKSQVEEPARGRGARGGARGSDDLERRLAELEEKLKQQGQTGPLVETPGVPAPASGETPPPLPTPEPTKPMSVSDAALSRELSALGGTGDPDYAGGLQAVQAGQCDEATAKLRAFLKKNPKSELADNAQYWIGECYYRQKNFNKAVVELNDVLSKYPKGDKVPGALLTLAAAFEDSGDKIDARLVLQKLISDHPKSEEADRARQRLQSLAD